MNLLLDVQSLNISIHNKSLVEYFSLQVHQGEVVCLVGESGSGKSLSSLALMGLLPNSAEVSAKCLSYKNQPLLDISEKEHRQLRGSTLSMIFQEPMTALNPCYTIGTQIEETLKLHTSMPKTARRQKVLELLHQVGIHEPEKRIKAYPHQLSGGMNQRAMIAMAIACQPELLIADEPTTALDVTIQAQILDLLLNLQQNSNMGMLLITHDLAVVSQVADRVYVMYAGQIVESGPASKVIHQPHHPYTQALIKALPEFSEQQQRLQAIDGQMPSPDQKPKGCWFQPRCPYAQDSCFETSPNLEPVATNESNQKYQNAHSRNTFREVRCFFPLHDEGVAS